MWASKNADAQIWWETFDHSCTDIKDAAGCRSASAAVVFFTRQFHHHLLPRCQEQVCVCGQVFFFSLQSEFSCIRRSTPWLYRTPGSSAWCATVCSSGTRSAPSSPGTSGPGAMEQKHPRFIFTQNNLTVLLRLFRSSYIDDYCIIKGNMLCGAQLNV